MWCFFDLFRYKKSATKLNKVDTQSDGRKKKKSEKESDKIIIWKIIVRILRKKTIDFSLVSRANLKRHKKIPTKHALHTIF